jgi:hypothetical protein
MLRYELLLLKQWNITISISDLDINQRAIYETLHAFNGPRSFMLIARRVPISSTMRRTKLPISALPAWCKLNDVTFIDTAVAEIEGKGFGLITERSLSSQDTFDTPTLLLVPSDLILSAAAIEEHAKADHHFRQLLDTAGGKVCTSLCL